MSEVEMEIATADKVIEIADAETRLVDMDSIQNHPENPRWHSRSQIEELAASLDDHDYASISLTVSSQTGNIVKGNGMYNALQLRQCQKVRVVWKDMTPLEELQFLIRDNRLSELSRWDLSVLNANLATLNDEGFELEDVGFELEAIEKVRDEALYRESNALYTEGEEQTAEELWEGMPEFEQEDLNCYQQIVIRFSSVEDVEAFAQQIGRTISLKTKYMNIPIHSDQWGYDKRV